MLLCIGDKYNWVACLSIGGKTSYNQPSSTPIMEYTLQYNILRQHLILYAKCATKQENVSNNLHLPLALREWWVLTVVIV